MLYLKNYRPTYQRMQFSTHNVLFSTKNIVSTVNIMKESIWSYQSFPSDENSCSSTNFFKRPTCLNIVLVHILTVGRSVTSKCLPVLLFQPLDSLGSALLGLLALLLVLSSLSDKLHKKNSFWSVKMAKFDMVKPVQENLNTNQRLFFR